MPDRSVAPDHSSSFCINLQKVQTTTLKNDVLLHSLEAGTQPLVKIEVIFPVGGSYYEEKAGAALLALKMLNEGTLSFTSSELSAHFAQYGAFINVTPSFDVASISLYCLSKHLNKVLAYFAEMVLTPVFPNANLKRIRQIEIQQLRMQNERSNITASKKFRNLIFGDENPYGKIIDEQNLEEITPDDLQLFHQQNLSNFEIIASGQVDVGIKSAINTFLGKGKKAETKRFFSHHLIKTGESDVREARPEALQSSIRMGKLTVDKTHPDYIPLLITTHILGGYFGSRLMRNIREDKGYTYGISSSLVSLKHDTWFVVGTDVKKGVAEETIAEVKIELQTLCTTPVSSLELATVKNHMLGHFQSELSSAFSLAEKFKSIHIHGLDYTYYEQFLTQLEDINSDKILSIANQYLDPMSMKTVVVG